jgi:hypothetical protein
MVIRGDQGERFQRIISQENSACSRRGPIQYSKQRLHVRSVTCGYGVRKEQRRAFVYLDEGACGSGNNRRYDSEGGSRLGNSIALTEV